MDSQRERNAQNGCEYAVFIDVSKENIRLLLSVSKVREIYDTSPKFDGDVLHQVAKLYTLSQAKLISLFPKTVRQVVHSFGRSTATM